MTLQEITAFLRARRKEKGIQQQNLAEYAGIQPASLARIEKGRDLKTSTLLRICEALELEVALKERERQ